LGSSDRPDHFKAEDEPVLLEDPVINTIAERHDATAAQVLLSWALHRDTAVIPKSVNPERLQQNLAAADLVLSNDDLNEIADLDRHRRYVDGRLGPGRQPLHAGNALGRIAAAGAPRTSRGARLYRFLPPPRSGPLTPSQAACNDWQSP
ncbi:MAG TPA: aldo/keto reductase, partial [Alcanivorax sp.]|nr:aldo/keto reductase [Alcanivorax sp.]